MLQVSSIRCYWYLLWCIIIELCEITRLYRLVIRLQKHLAKKKFLIGPTKKMLINLNLFTSKLFLVILLVSKRSKKKFLKTWELKLQLCIFSPAWEKNPTSNTSPRLPWVVGISSKTYIWLGCVWAIYINFLILSTWRFRPF